MDPENWPAFNEQMHQLLDACLNRLASARVVFETLARQIMPYATGNTHPSFFGWVHGTGLPVSVAADLVASTMNSNCGGRDHGAIEVEKAVLEWLLKLSGLPGQASAILTTGTSQATILAMSCARVRLFGDEIRRQGIQQLPQIRVYLSEGAHSCIAKALEVIGHGSNALHAIPVDENGQMNLDLLKQAVAQDREAGLRPMAVVGTAGSVNTGVFDPLDAIARFCSDEDLWFHVDAAFGFWIRLADDPWNKLANGIDNAHSIACDFHKWMSIPYDCGACMIYDRELHKRTFTSRPSYLSSQDQGLAGGDLWFCDYGLELSRGSRALKIWAAIKACGTEAFGQSITDNCKQAALMGELASNSDVLELAHPVISNLCCFRPLAGEPDQIAARLQLEGKVVFSTTVIGGQSCLRAAIVNHRTTAADIRSAVTEVENIVRQLQL